MRSLAVEWLGVRSFRNLTSTDIALGRGLNVFAGDNGQGKTSFLEAVYVLATSRSFRATKPGDVVQIGAETASVRGGVREDGELREQSVGLRRGQRFVRMDGKPPPSLADYAIRTPIVAFHPAALVLSAGGGTERRKLLDRVAFHRSPASLAESAAYSKAMRARQRLLETRGERSPGLEEWEELVVRHGLAVSDGREGAVGAIGSSAEEAFRRIGSEDLSLRASYQRSAPSEAAAYRAALEENRSKDRARGSATIGPHRDDLLLELSGRPVRGVASQGQHRTVVLALELAEMDVIARLRAVRPILLLDDVSSELDRQRTSALLTVLGQETGQVLLTTTRPELIGAAGARGTEPRRDFVVVRGEIRPT